MTMRITWLVAVLLALFAFRADTSEGDVAMKSIEVQESPTHVVIIFSREPRQVFGLDVANLRFIVAEPGTKEFRLRADAAESLRYELNTGTLAFRWHQSDGRHDLSWHGVPIEAWQKLRTLAASHLGNGIELREE